MAVPPWPQRVIDVAKTTLVRIVTIRPTQDGGRATGRVSGVGFIMEPSGYILTSGRAVRGASAILARLADGRVGPVAVTQHAMVACRPRISTSS